MKQASMPAMPVPQSASHKGLTKRQHIATIAMQGILSSEYITDFVNNGTMEKGVAKSAVAYADALLKELEND